MCARSIAELDPYLAVTVEVPLDPAVDEPAEQEGPAGTSEIVAAAANRAPGMKHHPLARSCSLRPAMTWNSPRLRRGA
jgi:hypothetical protein